MVLAFETSCDETSVAVVADGAVRSNVVTSQIRLHAEYGGVVPELATREHLAHLIPATRQALAQADADWSQVKVIAATRGPGLPAALMAGFTAAQTVAWARGLPLFGVHHHEAHLYSPWTEGTPPRSRWETLVPHVALIVSGGHTLLVHVRGPLDHVVLGGTLDDAAGECFDKTAKLLGLPYPGGPWIDRLAAEGRPETYVFPRPLLHDRSDDFSFSGLKTSVRTFLERHPGLADDGQALRDLCAGVQAAIVEVLAEKAVRAARRRAVGHVTASGGVSCNRGLRDALKSRCDRHGLTLRIADPALCTDNAAMIGLLAEWQWRSGRPPTAADAPTIPGWALSDTAAAAETDR